MNIKVCIANFGENQLFNLKQVLQELEKIKKFNLDVTVYTTVPVEANHILFDQTIGCQLPFMCREDIVKSIDQYDLFLYNENDHVITEKNIESFLELQKILPKNFIAGFLRYEYRDNKKILVDVGPDGNWCTLIKENYGNFFSVGNNHQGCYLLTKQQLRHCIDSGEFLHKIGRGPYGILEQGATDPYNKCGLIKVFPSNKQQLENHLIWHTSQKYCNHPTWLQEGITIDDLILKLQ